MVSNKFGRTLTALVFFGCVLNSQSFADTLSEPVSAVAFCSKDGTVFARSTVAPAELEVHAAENPGRTLWSRGEFVAKGFVSDDGRPVVSCYQGLNLLPIDATLDFLLV